jgi:hypothetical protein
VSTLAAQSFNILEIVLPRPQAASSHITINAFTLTITSTNQSTTPFFILTTNRFSKLYVLIVQHFHIGKQRFDNRFISRFYFGKTGKNQSKYFFREKFTTTLLYSIYRNSVNSETTDFHEKVLFQGCLFNNGCLEVFAD